MSVLLAALRRSRRAEAVPPRERQPSAPHEGDDGDEAGPAVGPEIGRDQVRTYLRAASARSRRRFGPFKLLGLVVAGSIAGAVLALSQTTAPMPRELLAWLDPLARAVRERTSLTLALAPRPQPPAIDFAAVQRPEPAPLPDHVRRGLANAGATQRPSVIGVAGAVRSALESREPASSNDAGRRAVQPPAVSLDAAGETPATPAKPVPRLARAIAAMAATPTRSKGATSNGGDRNADAIRVTVTKGDGAGSGADGNSAGDPTRLVPDGTMTLPGRRETGDDRNPVPDGGDKAEAGADEAPGRAVARKPVTGTTTVQTPRRIEAPRITATHRQAARALRRGAPAEAARLFRRVLHETPNRPDALFGLALAQQRMGETGEARTTYRKLLKVEPGNQRALRNLIALAARGSPQQALKRLKRVREAHPNVAQVHARIARTHMRTGNPGAAARAMRRVVSLAPSSVRYRYDLAVLHDHAGNRRRAIAAYRRVLSAKAEALQDAGIAASAVRRRLRYLSR